MRTPKKCRQPPVAVVESENERAVIRCAQRLDRIPVPQIPVCLSFRPQSIERPNDRLGVARRAGVESEPGAKHDPPFEPVVAHLPILRQQWMTPPVGAFHDHRLVDGHARRIDVRRVGVKRRELVIECLAEDHANA